MNCALILPCIKLYDIWHVSNIQMEKAMAPHSSTLENPMDRGAWWAAVHGIAESRTRLSDFTFTFHFHEKKEMATHSIVLPWRIPGMEEPDRLLSMGSHRVGHDWSDLAGAAPANIQNPGYYCMSGVIMRLLPQKLCNQ